MRKGRILSPLPILFVLSFFGISSAGPFGALEPPGPVGSLSLKVGYFRDSDEWKLSSGNQKVELVQNQFYLQLSAAVLREMEVFIRGGMVDLHSINLFRSPVATGNLNISGSDANFDDGLRPFGTIGAKGYFPINSWLSIGPAFQASLFSSYSDSTSGTASGTPVTQSARIHGKYEIMAGFFAQDKFNIDDLSTRVMLYAGPFVYWNHARLDTSVTSPVATFASTTGSSYLNEDLNIGGAGGATLSFRNGINLQVEGQVRQEFSIGVAMSYSFK